MNKALLLSGVGLLTGGIVWTLADQNYIDFIPINQGCRGFVNPEDPDNPCPATCHWYAKYFYQEGCYDVAEDDYMRYIPFGLLGGGIALLLLSMVKTD